VKSILTRFTDKHAKHTADSLSWVQQIMDARPTITPNRHAHDCACGDRYICGRTADKCGVIEPFVCQNCAMEQQDAYITELEKQAQR